MSFDQRQGLEQVQEEQQPRIYNVTEGNSKHTKATYRIAFKHFLKETIKNDNLRTLFDTKPSVIESKIIDHVSYLKDVRKLTYRSIMVHLSAIYYFFEINDVVLNTRKINRLSLPENESDHYARDRPYSVGEIEQILSKCPDLRTRAAVLIMVSSGVRIGGLRELRLCDIKKNDEFGLYMLWVYNRSGKDRYYTFTTPECAAAIDAYLDYRRRRGDELKETAPLIRDKFNIDDPFTAMSPKPISIRMLSFIFEDVLKRAGVNQKRDVMRSHGFRKFFITECDKAHMPFTVREYLSGHRLPNQDASYNLPSVEDRLAEYVKAIPFLSIDDKQRLRQENAELRENQDNYLAELGELKEDFNEMKQWLVGLQKGNQKELVKEFYKMTADKIQDEWWASDEAKEYYSSK